MYSCYSRVNFYLCLSWHSSLFRVESQSCSLWLLPIEGKKRANNMASWGKKIKTKRFKGNGRCSRVSPGTRRNYRHREVSVSNESCVSVKWLKTAGKGSFSPSGDREMFVNFGKMSHYGMSRDLSYWVKLIKVHDFMCAKFQVLFSLLSYLKPSWPIPREASKKIAV